MKALLFLWLSLLVLWGHAQQIYQAEYFFNEDPGFGNGTSISFEPGAIVEFNFDADAQYLDPGIHFLYVRVYDGTWSQVYRSMILKENNKQITQAEYFFNEDPGYGNGTSISFEPGAVVEFNFDADAQHLEPGIHFLYVRVYDGTWSQVYRSMILKENNRQITQAEYFFNEDPGYGNGTSISFEPGAVVEFNFDADAQHLDPGIHFLYVRVYDGTWSQVYRSMIFKENNRQITQAEYFFNEDPGYGNGIPITFEPGTIVDLDFDALIEDFSFGMHQISFRVFSEVWSQTYTHEFCNLPVIDFSTNIVQYGNPTTFSNLSESTDESISFFWDVNGDGEIDYTGPDDFAHIYEAPGIYPAKLLIEIEGGCSDSIFKEVLVLEAMPDITEIPVASSIIYGQALGESVIEGGEAAYNSQPVPGSFVFVYPDTIPQSAGVFFADVKFIPDDNETFAEVSLQIEVDVDVKELIITGSFTAHNKTYDGTTNASMDDNQLELSGVIHDDEVTLTGIVLQFAQAEPGYDILVSIVEAQLVGEDDSNYSLSLQDAPTATANIYAISYTLDLLAEPEDIGAILEGAGEYEAGEEVTISASEVEGYDFTGWSGSSDDMDLIENPALLTLSFIMPERDVTLTANYQEYEPELFMVTLYADPPDIEAVLTGAGEYEAGEEVTISASEVEGYDFTGWTGSAEDMDLIDDPGLISQIFFMPDRDISFTAQFTSLPDAEYVMQIMDAQGTAGAELTVEISITNVDGFTGFNLDIPLPGGFSFVEGTEELYRKDDHFLSIAIIEGNVVRLISASPSNAEFSGNEGTIVSFDLQTPEGEGGTFTLPIINAVIGNAAGDNVLTETIDGVITLEATEPPPVYEYFMILHDAEGIAGEQITINMEITNEAEFTGFNLDIPLPEGFSFVEGTEELYRKDDHFLSIAIIEDNVMRLISASPSNAEFSGNEGTIVSFDLQTPEGEGGTFTLPITNAIIGNATGENVLTETIDGNITLETPEPPPVYEYFMILHDAEGVAGEQITINMEITNEAEFIGFNLDIPLPEGFSFVEGTDELYREDDHSHSVSVIEDNILRIISASPSNSPFIGEEGVILSFELFTPQAVGSYTLEIINAVIGNAAGENVITGSQNGQITLLQGYEPELFILTLIAEPAEGGTVYGGGEYEEGENVTLIATANENWEFINWTDTDGNVISNEAEFVHSMPAEDLTLTANFQESLDVNFIGEINPYPYPNPFREIIIIMNSEIISFVRITDLLGSIVLEKHLANDSEKVSLNLGYLHNGIYIIQMQDHKGRQWVERIVKQ